MDAATQKLTSPDLSHAGLRNLGQVYYNLSKAELYEHTIKRGEGFISKACALMCDTGKTTGRSPNIAEPTPTPVKPDSQIGVSMMRLSPNSFSSPWVTL